HNGEPAPLIVKSGALTIDLPRRLVTRRGELVHLSPREYELLAKLAQNVGKVMQHRHLLISIWGPAHAEDTQYLRVFIGQLRQKIEGDPSEPQVILTEPGIGYRFVTDDMLRVPPRA
ncbi:MAG TPA: winged helix-turn-helix domain-containing protein, partial [Phenylobacterium sp.]|nr:winged helix-turn-helix domain-containing protein [Phenylobacterium sp.]